MVEREIEINAPIEKVYSVIRNFSAYPEFIPSTKSAEEDEDSTGPEVDFSLQVIKPIRYRLKFKCDEPNGLKWSLVKGEFMKRNSGSWNLKSLGPKKTLATYKIDVEFGWMVPKMIVDELTRIQLPELLEAFKKRAEA
jgi:ribosome-associated toxin RatA of RatAB toxin-antitoxin module